MKRFIAAISVLFLTLALIAGCGSQQPQDKKPAESPSQTVKFKDGIYSAEEAKFDEHGWKAVTTIIVKGGKIERAFYDEINNDKQIKSLDQEYATNMKKQTKENPLDATTKLSVSLIKNQDPEKIDAVSGATGTSDRFKNLAKKALKGSPEEKSTGGLYDGLYKAQAKDFDEHGYKAYATVIINDGKIVNTYYDELNKDTDTYKSKDDDYQKNMKAGSGVSDNEAYLMLIHSLVDKQDVSKVDAVTGATSTTDNFKELMNEALSFAK